MEGSLPAEVRMGPCGCGMLIRDTFSKRCTSILVGYTPSLSVMMEGSLLVDVRMGPCGCGMLIGDTFSKRCTSIAAGYTRSPSALMGRY